MRSQFSAQAQQELTIY